MQQFLNVCAALLALSVTSDGSDLYQLILEGNIEQAADSLSSVSTASTRDGNLLFYAGMLETDGARAARFMQAALQASVSPLHREQIYLRLAQYHLLNRHLDSLGDIITEYLTRWETGRYRDEMLRYSILIDDLKENRESALRQIDRYGLEYTTGDAAQWGRIDKARILLQAGKKIGAAKVLKGLSRQKDGAGVPAALYLLTLGAIADGRTDDAVFHYSILRESFPSSIGCDALLDRMSKVSTSDEVTREADKVTGTFYSVRLGVFSVKGNADRMAADFSHYGKKVEKLRKVISDKSYHVVYIGRFRDYESASKFKEKLQAEHNQVFQVVAR